MIATFHGRYLAYTVSSNEPAGLPAPAMADAPVKVPKELLGISATALGVWQHMVS
jgi:hypothetical protein